MKRPSKSIVGCCGLTAALVAASAAAGLKERGELCQGRWCWREPTRILQDGPNCVQYPQYRFCDRCYHAFVRRRRELYLHVDPREGKVIIGNQLFDRGELQSSRVRVYDLDPLAAFDGTE